MPPTTSRSRTSNARPRRPAFPFSIFPPPLADKLRVDVPVDAFRTLAETIPSVTGLKSVSIAWKDVTFEGKGAPLYGVSGNAEPGRVLVIMGPPRSGKTKLLNILSGRVVEGGGKNQHLTGDFEVNGEPKTPYEFREHVGYVIRNESLYMYSTVRESLEFVAGLRMPSSAAVSKEQRARIVDDVIQSLGLAPFESTLAKGLSPFHRKLLAFGLELVTLASVVFLDEPTAQLDPISALRFYRVVATAARRANLTVVMSVQQPSSELFAETEHVMLMSGGHVVMQGHSRDMAAVFQTKGLVPPAGVSVVDFATTCARVLTVEELPNDDKNDKAHRANGDGKRLVPAGGSLHLKPKDVAKQGAYHPVPRANFFVQWWYLLVREFHATFARNKILLVGRTVVTIFVSLLIGVVFLNQGDQTRSATYTVAAHAGSIMLTLFVGAFGALSPAVIALGPERPIYVRERMEHLYGWAPWHLAKIVFELVVNFWVACLTVLILYWLIGWHGSFMWLVCGIFLSLSVNFSWGHFLVAFAPNMMVAMALVPLVLVPQLLFLGGFLRAQYASPVLSWCRFVSFLVYAVHILLGTEFHPANCIDPYCPQFAGLLVSNGVSPDDRWWEALVLVAFYVGLRALAIVRLEFRAKQSKRSGPERGVLI